MITSILSNNPSIANGMAHVLSRIDYKKLNNGLRYAEKNADSHHLIVLFEYVNSGIYDTIAEIERIPGTTCAIHEFLQNPDVLLALRSLLGTLPRYNIYTRRKMDRNEKGELDFTKHRQLVLYVGPELPSLIQPIEYSTDSYDADRY